MPFSFNASPISVGGGGSGSSGGGGGTTLGSALGGGAMTAGGGGFLMSPASLMTPRQQQRRGRPKDPGERVGLGPEPFRPLGPEDFPVNPGGVVPDQGPGEGGPGPYFPRPGDTPSGGPRTGGWMGTPVANPGFLGKILGRSGELFLDAAGRRFSPRTGGGLGTIDPFDDPESIFGPDPTPRPPSGGPPSSGGPPPTRVIPNDVDIFPTPPGGRDLGWGTPNLGDRNPDIDFIPGQPYSPPHMWPRLPGGPVIPPNGHPAGNVPGTRAIPSTPLPGSGGGSSGFGIGPGGPVFGTPGRPTPPPGSGGGSAVDLGSPYTNVNIEFPTGRIPGTPTMPGGPPQMPRIPQPPEATGWTFRPGPGLLGGLSVGAYILDDLIRTGGGPWRPGGPAWREPRQGGFGRGRQ